MASDKDVKLNFDTSPEEIISADRNCSICYGRGEMLVAHPITQMPNDESYSLEECLCIRRKREARSREKHLAIYRGV